MILFSVCIYLMITLIIGLFAARRVHNSRDFVLAGRQLPLFMCSSVIFATWFGSETILGASGEFLNGGFLSVIEDPFGASLCLILVGAFFAAPLYRKRILTIGDFYRNRYNRRVEGVAAVFMILSYLGWIAAQMVALGLILKNLAGVPLAAGISVSAAVVLIYTMVGGMWAVSVTDAIQTVLIIGGLAVLSAEVVGDAGGLVTTLKQAPEGTFKMLPEGSVTNWLHYIAAWITIGLGSIPQQDVFQRVMAAKSEKIAVRASYLGGILYLTIALLPLLIVLAASQAYPELLTGGHDQGIIPRIALAAAHPVVQVLFFGALLSAILSTASGAVLAPAVILAENIIKPRYHHKLTDRHLLLLMRLSVVIIVLISGGLALSHDNIYELVGESSALSLVSLFVPLTAGLFWKKATASGAFWSMAVGMAAWLLAKPFDETVPGLIVGLTAATVTMIGISGLSGMPSSGTFRKQTH